MTTDAPHDPRFLDGDALRVARVKALEKAFGITLTAEESARCTSAEETTSVFAARLGAVAGDGNLRAGALAAVREALCDVVRADREAIDARTQLRPLFERWAGAKRWTALGRELQCKLPLIGWRRLTIAVVAPILTLQVAFIAWYPSHHVVDETTISALVVLAALGVAGLLSTGALFELPQRMTTVENLVTWLVAQKPVAYRAGTEWTAGQVAEAVGAVHGLRFLRPGCRRALTRHAVTALLVLAMIVASLWLCGLGLDSKVPVGPVPPSVR